MQTHSHKHTHFYTHGYTHAHTYIHTYIYLLAQICTHAYTCPHTLRHSKLKVSGEDIYFVMYLPVSLSLQNPLFQREGMSCFEWERQLWFVKVFSCTGRKDILPCGLELHSRKLQTDFHTFF